MLRAAAGVLIFALALSVATAAQARYASIVIDYDTGRVLHESNADTRNYPASLAKMMTLYLAFEALERGDIALDRKLKVSRRAAGMPAAKLGLKRGETITVENAILALITKSANDAAVVVAEALGGKETKFARMMTRKAKALGMKRTQFRNASGLPNRRQLSTARDMATLARALIRDFPKYYKLFSTKEFVYKGRRHRNHNRLLRKYAGADGLKTGYIRASGFNLAASVSRNGRRLIAVVFGGKTPRSRDRHIAKLLDRGFAKLASTGSDKIPPPPPRKPSFALAGDFAPATGITSVATPKRPAARKAAPAEVGSAEKPIPDPSWAIQVGAYYRYKPAKRAAVAAAKRFPDLLEDTRVMITHVKGQRGRIYRSRLVGLTEAKARTACRRLEKAKVDCLVIRVGRKIALAS
ncbi:MAG: D-alanyl-D-alanine carboxypeptidase [Proteobacteria bacterium]|nr:D-alanyl-D-alanine carboxypeptidase [Pseudomonadota bacterium]